tara:strand:+ start:2305 stop:2754 length:450 start_codon:yes stop_codon:yes gene_type:complete
MDLLQSKPKEPAQQQSSFDPAKIYVWVKALEGKVNNLVRELNLLKNDAIKKTNRLEDNLKIANRDLLELKHEQSLSLKKMDVIIKELQQTAGAEQLQTLKKYVDFWNPINFVTQRDVERIVEQKIIDSKTTKKTEFTSKLKAELSPRKG